VVYTVSYFREDKTPRMSYPWVTIFPTTAYDFSDVNCLGLHPFGAQLLSQRTISRRILATLILNMSYDNSLYFS
jgi:hypothetical protein